MIRKYFSGVFVLGSFVLILSACGKKDSNSPGVEFMPDMYRSPSVEVYNINPMYADSMGSRLPVAGTIPRGFMPYPYSNDTAGYATAGRELKNPIALTSEVLKEGEELYGKFCVNCHGASGGGDGLVSTKLPGAPPAYSGALKNLPEGKIFHTMTFGKGLMGSHASQLTQEERWKLVHYVQKLQHINDAPAADSTKTAMAKSAEENKKK
ncbi:MAG: cytochrome c [Bacteroidia bacterium]|nr:cytochrome c [Bacteroidia bacterium]